MPVSDIRRVLILGNSGFIGSQLERYLRDHSPAVEIVGCATSHVDLTKGEEVFSLGDLCDRNTALVMCAAIKRQVADDLGAFHQNLQMTMNLCRLLQDRPVGRFVFLSSAAVYGEDVHNTDITEETPVCPTSYYGIAKYTAECLFRKVIDQTGHGSLLILRPAVIYGPSEKKDIYSPSGFAKAALRGEQITLWGDGRERRDFIFIDDLVEIVFRLTFHEFAGVLNVASGNAHSFMDAIDIVSHLIHLEQPTASRPRTKRKVDHVFSNQALVKLLPTFAFTCLQDGISRALAADSRCTKPNTQKIRV